MQSNGKGTWWWSPWGLLVSKTLLVVLLRVATIIRSDQRLATALCPGLLCGRSCREMCSAASYCASVDSEGAAALLHVACSGGPAAASIGVVLNIRSVERGFPLRCQVLVGGWLGIWPCPDRSLSLRERALLLSLCCQKYMLFRLRQD